MEQEEYEDTLDAIEHARRMGRKAWGPVEAIRYYANQLCMTRTPEGCFAGEIEV